VEAPLVLLVLPEGSVSSVAFSPDGHTLAAGFGSGRVDGRGGVVLSDVAGRTRLVEAPLVLPEGSVSSVAFSPDGHTLAAGHSPGRVDGRGGVVLWDVDFNFWRRLARQVANRNLTRAEWRQYFPDRPYRATFDDLPVPPEMAPTAALGRVPARDMSKIDLE
jgi:WD40 repeat protein